MVNLRGLAEAFSNENPKVTISVTAAARARHRCPDQQADRHSRRLAPMKDEEVQDAEANGVNPVETQVALDGLSVVVNPNNPVTELSIRNCLTSTVQDQ